MTLTRVEPDPPSTVPPSKNRTRTSRVVAGLAALLMTAAVAVGAAPAQAAQVTQNDEPARVCFYYSNGSPYTYNVYPVLFTNGKWEVQWHRTQYSSDGCTSWTLAAGYEWSFQADYRDGTVYWTGRSTSLHVYEGQSYDFGSGYVTENRY